MSRNTNLWHNDPFTQTTLPASGNNPFGADRSLCPHGFAFDCWSLSPISLTNQWQVLSLKFKKLKNAV